MPELPEVEALREYLDEHLAGRVVERVLPLAVSVLKTYDPPLTALEGQTAGATARHGKFLAMRIGELHLVTHLARAGWLRWQDTLPAQPPRPGKGPLALRVVLEGGGGFDLTEAGTQKRLAVYVVRDPQEVPGIARLGPDPLAESFDREAFAALLAGSGGRSRACCGTRASSRASETPTATRSCTTRRCRRSSWPPPSTRTR